MSSEFWQGLWSAAAILVGLLMWAARVPPEQAASSLAGWARVLGFRNPPAWLKTQAADRAVRHAAGVVLVLLCLAGLFLFLGAGAMQIGPKVTLVVGFVCIASAITWNYFQPDEPATPGPEIISREPPVSFPSPVRSEPTRPNKEVDSPSASPLSENFLIWHFASRAPGSLARAETLLWTRYVDRDFRITFFRVRGKNQTDTLLLNADAYIVCEISGQKIQLAFEDPERMNVGIDTKEARVDPGASFALIGTVPSPPQEDGSEGQTASQFLEIIGGFELVFEAGDIRFKHKFNYAEVKQMVEALEARHGPRPPPPTVRRKP